MKPKATFIVFNPQHIGKNLSILIFSRWRPSPQQRRANKVIFSFATKNKIHVSLHVQKPNQKSFSFFVTLIVSNSHFFLSRTVNHSATTVCFQREQLYFFLCCCLYQCRPMCVRKLLLNQKTYLQDTLNNSKGESKIDSNSLPLPFHLNELLRG